MMQEPKLIELIAAAIQTAKESAPSRENSLALTRLEEAMFWALRAQPKIRKVEE